MAVRDTRNVSIKSFIIKYLEENKTGVVDRRVLAAICREAQRALQREKPVSRTYVLDVLSETQVEIDRAIGGLPVDLRGRVHFHDQEAAAASLTDMANEYEAARLAGDKPRAEDCRRAVRKGKDRLKLVLRRTGLTPQKRQQKQELIEWFLIWLEAPSLFPTWLEARRAAGAANDRIQPGAEPPAKPETPAPD
ncbi:MAG: hypothetical protein WD733_00255 [Bryobacterales bacterium]